MCIISFNFKEHPKYKLIITANRDEFYNRPTKNAHFWPDQPNLLAGRDLKAMGTWLGITRSGRFAALTNYRDLSQMDENKRSRGEIVTDFLTGNVEAPTYLSTLQRQKDQYNGFNIITGTVDELYYYSNQQNEIQSISPGTHSVSNHLINTPWPKVKRSKQLLLDYVMINDELDIEILFSQLANNELAPDEALPKTGVGLELERKLSPIFIRTDDYGTRSATVILVSNDNEVLFYERVFNSGNLKAEKHFQFSIKQ